MAAARDIEGFRGGSWGGLATDDWLLLAAASAIVHQLYVWFCWRTELHMGWLSRALGPAAFSIYGTVFLVLVLARPVLIVALARSNRWTLPIDPALGDTLAVVFLAPCLWTLWSTGMYFGRARAMGQDHFDREAARAPLVRRGAFRITGNAMYTFGFLGLYVPAFAYGSVAALAAALFQHAAIWAHYTFTERPDMQFMHGGGHSSSANR